MLTMVHLRTKTGTFLASLPVTNSTDSSPFIITDIQGLGPVKADVFTSAYSPLDGGVYQGARTGMRNLVFSIRYNPDYSSGATVESLRRDLYTVFPPKRDVRLHFVDLTYPEVFIDGYVESHETSIFTREPEVQISVICPEPYFSDRYPTTLNGTTGTKILKSDLYTGTADTGFRFVMTLNQSIGWMDLYSGTVGSLTYTRGLKSGEKVQISTQRGDKYTSYYRNDTWTNDIQQITSGSLALAISPQSEHFLATVASGAAIPYTLTFTTKYVGI